MYESLLRLPLQTPETVDQGSIDLLVEVLKSPATGNAFLLIASVIGVPGSYFLYKKRRKDSRLKLKRALASELEQMDQIPVTAENLENLSNEPPESRLTASLVPPAETFPTTVYEENAPELGLLEEETLDEVVNFYTKLIQHKGIIQGVRSDPEDVPMPDHEKIADEFPELVDRRKSLISKLSSENGDGDR